MENVFCDMRRKSHVSSQTDRSALEKQHQKLEQEICDVQAHPSCDDLKLAELKRRKLLMKDEIVHVRRDVGALVSRMKLKASEKRKAAARMAERKSSSWYEDATRSISISKTNPL
jgi:hypothetical protein